MEGTKGRFLLGTPLFIELGSKGRLFTLNGVGNKEKANLVSIVPAGNIPFQGGELPPVKDGLVEGKDLEHYILSYLEKISGEDTPKITIQQAYLLKSGIFTTEKPR